MAAELSSRAWVSGHRSLCTCWGPRPPRAVLGPAGQGQCLHSDDRWVTYVMGVHTPASKVKLAAGDQEGWEPTDRHPGESPRVSGSACSQGLSVWEGTSAGSSFPRPRLPCPSLLLSPPRGSTANLPSFVWGTSSLVTISRRSGSGVAETEAPLPGSLSRVETHISRQKSGQPVRRVRARGK